MLISFNIKLHVNTRLSPTHTGHNAITGNKNSLLNALVMSQTQKLYRITGIEHQKIIKTIAKYFENDTSSFVHFQVIRTSSTYY